MQDVRFNLTLIICSKLCVKLLSQLVIIYSAEVDQQLLRSIYKFIFPYIPFHVCIILCHCSSNMIILQYIYIEQFRKHGNSRHKSLSESIQTQSFHEFLENT